VIAGALLRQLNFGQQLMSEVLIIIGGLYMVSSIFPALLMSAVAFLMTFAQIALFKALLHRGIKN